MAYTHTTHAHNTCTHTNKRTRAHTLFRSSYVDIIYYTYTCIDILDRIFTCMYITCMYRMISTERARQLW
jgi:hypothetical protein